MEIATSLILDRYWETTMGDIDHDGRVVCPRCCTFGAFSSPVMTSESDQAEYMELRCGHCKHEAWKWVDGSTLNARRDVRNAVAAALIISAAE